MNHSIRSLVTRIAPAVAVLVMGCGGSTTDSPRPEPRPVTVGAEPATGSPVDFAAPALVDVTLSGEPFRFDSLRGSTVLVNFWATWCGPCLREIPDLIDLRDELGSARFEVVGVAYNDPDTSGIESMVRDLEIPYPILIDGDGDWAEAFGGVYVMPTSFVVEPGGRVTTRITGLVHPDSLRGLLSQSTPDQP